MAVSQVAGPRFRDCGPFMGRASRILPAAIFANGEQGTWYEPGPDTCFQDDAGTTPADEGDPIGYLTDLSGNGNHATQSTAARRPTLQQTAGGLWYLDFDGVDDRQSTGTIDLTSTDEITVVAGVEKHSNPSRGAVVNFPDNGFNAFTLEAPRSVNDNTRFSAAGDSYLLDYSTALALNTPVVYTGQAILSGSLLLRENGAVINESDTLNFGGGNFGTGVMTLGEFTVPAGRNFDGRIYGLIVIDRALTASEIASVEAYMAQRSGVTL